MNSEKNSPKYGHLQATMHSICFSSLQFEICWYQRHGSSNGLGSQQLDGFLSRQVSPDPLQCENGRINIICIHICEVIFVFCLPSSNWVEWNVNVEGINTSFSSLELNVPLGQKMENTSGGTHPTGGCGRNTNPSWFLHAKQREREWRDAKVFQCIM